MKPKILPSDLKITNVNRLPVNTAGLSYSDAAASKKASGFKDLCGNWRFLFVKAVGQEPENYYMPEYDDSGFNKIAVPSNWQLEGDYDEPIYSNYNYPYALESRPFHKLPAVNLSKTSAGIYRLAFNYTKPRGEKSIILKFEGIQAAGYIYLNGKFVGYTEDSFGISEFDITEHIHTGKNLLAVKVLRYCTGSYLEDQDMWRMSGIIRPVSIYAVPKSGIANFFARCDFDKEFVNATFRLNATTDCPDEGLTLDASLLRDGKPVYSFSAPFTRPPKSKVGKWQTAIISGDCPAPEKWSFEAPELYRLSLVMKNAEGNTVDIKGCDFGFRKVEILRGSPLTNSQPALLLNGVSIKLRGVNRHEFHPDYGFAVPESLNLSDMQLLKRNHFNAIRTSHYPPSEALASICDRVGLLVMCENNLETHGLARRIPRSGKQWASICCERLRRMVQRYRNHPSIFMWSLGNESGKGDTFFKMARLCRSLDSTRPIHYECDSDCSDVISAMYEPTEQLLRMVNGRPIDIGQNIYNVTANRLTYKKYAAKPFLLCEYAHCMGNSLGNFSWYWDLILKHSRFIGGFIWDFADLAIHKDGKYLYGGDFGDKPNDGNFCFNGLLRGDRSLNPAMYEAKNQLCPLRFELSGSFLTAKYLGYYVPLSGLRLEYTVFTSGQPAFSGKIGGVEFAPGSAVNFELDLSAARAAESADLTVKLIAESVPGFESGEVYYQQSFCLKPSGIAVPPPAVAKITQSEQKIEILYGENTANIDAKTGALLSLVTKGGKPIELSMLPNVFRAPTDNFAGLVLPPIVRKMYRPDRFKGMRDKITVGSVSIGQGGVAMRLRAPGLSELGVSYAPLENGALLIKMYFNSHNDLPKFGAQFRLNGSFTGIKYYGRGEHENYPDRCCGAVYDVYTATPESLFHKYLKPQDAGNRTDVAWAEIEGEGAVIKLTPIERANISAYPYSDEQLCETPHEAELTPADFITFNLDGGVSGVGGDKPGMACLKDEYRIKPGERQILAFMLEVFDIEAAALAEPPAEKPAKKRRAPAKKAAPKKNDTAKQAAKKPAVKKPTPKKAASKKPASQTEGSTK